MRLILHTAAYWLLRRVQQAIPKTAALARAEFTTLRLRLLKVAARVMEIATRIRIAFASACPTPICCAPSFSRSSLGRHSKCGSAAETPNPILQPEKPIDPSTVKNSGEGACPRQAHSRSAGAE